LKRENEPYKNLWCFPGGKIEDKEIYSEATKREVFEETGKRYFT
jgi:ADP-ribose pyrophosphatase YjhB (NUDIX family)